jgi:tetratricopeptide (TPR) repeat protein
MNNKLVRLSLALLLVLFAGCATFIGLSVLKPSEINIGPVKKIAVLDFEFRGDWKFWHEDKGLSWEDLAKSALAKHFGLTGPDDKPLDPLSAYPGREVAVKFIAQLVENGHYQVLERAELEKVMVEHQLTMAGLVNETQAAEIGKLLGVEAVLFGMGSYTVSDAGDWQERTRKEKYKEGDKTKEREIKYTVYEAVRTVNAELTYRVVSITTGLVIASKTNRASHRLTAENDQKPEAYQNLPLWRPAVDQLVGQILSQAVVQIAPHVVSERREIKSGKTRTMKAGLEYAKRGMLAEALAQWQQTLEDNSDKGRKDRVAAWYNIGIYHEINGDLDQAAELFDRCFTTLGDEDYLDAKARVLARKEELKRLEQQQQGTE